MSENQELIQRVKTALRDQPFTEEPAFGGYGFRTNGSLFCGVLEDALFLFIGEDRFEEILTHPLARPFEMDGQLVPGWVLVLPTGIKREVDLAGWIRNALNAINAAG